jgi:hypothetical protein
VELRRYQRDLERRFGAADNSVPSVNRRSATIERFIKSRSASTARDLKWLCYGVADSVGEQERSILADAESFAALLKLVAAARSKAGLLRRCYQGLLSAYFEYDGMQAKSEAARASWTAIRQFLATHRGYLLQSATIPAWVLELEAHRNLLSESPCDRYAKSILNGDYAEFDEMREALAISKSSWVVSEALLSAVRRACDDRDKPFLEQLDKLLDLLKSNELVQAEGLALVLQRYCLLNEPLLHPELRDYAISLWGSPLLQKNLKAWDVAGPDATQMVAHWLKSRLIEDFFELLSSDGSTDKSRVRFWQRYVKSISDIYFALGRDALFSRRPDFVALRKTMGTSLLRLDNMSSSNNAFIMVINGFVVMEFGESGGASFIFDRKNMPFELRGAISGSGRSRWPFLARMLHLSVKSDGSTWQEEFERQLRTVVGVVPDDTALLRPTARPQGASHAAQRARPACRVRWSPQALADARRECAQFGVYIQDDVTSKSYVVRAGNANGQLCRTLELLGFEYDPLGFWQLSYSK